MTAIVTTPRAPEQAYLTVSKQFDDQGFLIPLEQVSNINALVIDERTQQQSWGGGRLDHYEHEAPGAQHLCMVYSNGEFCGANNFRAMAGIVKDIRDGDPEAVILVHRLGTKVDFELVDKLLPPLRADDYSQLQCPPSGLREDADII